MVERERESEDEGRRKRLHVAMGLGNRVGKLVSLIAEVAYFDPTTGGMAFSYFSLETL